MKTKQWWKSKTIWVNIIMLVAMLLRSELGFDLTAGETGALLVIINLILRAITGSGLELRRK